MTGLIHSLDDLQVYQKSNVVASRVLEMSESFPSGEKFALTSQLRRASRSIGAQIAEAWAKRRYPRHFVSKLSDADAEQMETRHWLQLALDSGYVDRKDASEVLDLLDEIGRMQNGMMAKAERFRTHRSAATD